MEFKTNRYTSVRHNHVFLLGNDYKFRSAKIYHQATITKIMKYGAIHSKLCTIEALLLRSVQTAFAHRLPFPFSDSDQSVRSSCPSLILSALDVVHKALPPCAVADCIANRSSVRSQNTAVAYLGILFGGRRGLTNSVEDRGQRERGSGGGSFLEAGFWRQL